MDSYRFIVLSNPKPGMEDEYNDWYSNRHIHDITRVPGFVAAQRFKWTPRRPGDSEPQFRYLAIYEIETDDVEVTFAGLAAVSGTDAAPISEALGERLAKVYGPITPRVTAR